jgi:hypothetical protein
MKLNKVKAEEMGHRSQVSILAAARGGILEHNKKVALTSGNTETFILLSPSPPMKYLGINLTKCAQDPYKEI